MGDQAPAVPAAAAVMVAVAAVAVTGGAHPELTSRMVGAHWGGGGRYFSVLFGSILHANVPESTAVNTVQVPPDIGAPLLSFALLCVFPLNKDFRIDMVTRLRARISVGLQLTHALPEENPDIWTQILLQGHPTDLGVDIRMSFREPGALRFRSCGYRRRCTSFARAAVCG